MATRLADLQLLLKTEEAEALAQRKTLDAVEQHLQRATDDLVDAYWELRDLYDQLDRFTAPSQHKQQYDDPPNVGARGSSTVRPADVPRVVPSLPSQTRRDIEELISTLKMRPDCLIELILGSNWGEGRAMEKSVATSLARAVVFSLFGNCFSPSDEKRLLLFVVELRRREIELTPTKPSFAMEVLTVYLRATTAGPYLTSTLRDIIVASCSVAAESTHAPLVSPNSPSPTSPPQPSAESRRMTLSSANGTQGVAGSGMTGVVPSVSAHQRSATNRTSFRLADQRKPVICQTLPKAPTTNVAVSAAAAAAATPAPAPAAQPSALQKSKSPPHVTTTPTPTLTTARLWTKPSLGTAEEQLLDAVQQPWLLTVPFLARNAILSISQSLHSLPYGLRWVTSALYKLDGMSTRSTEREFVVETVFTNFIASALSYPEEWMLHVTPPSVSARRNLAEIARLIVEAARTCGKVTGDPVLQQLDAFVSNVTKVEDPDTYFDMDKWADSPLTIVSMGDLDALVAVISLGTSTVDALRNIARDQVRVAFRLHSLAESIYAAVRNRKTAPSMLLRIRDMTAVRAGGREGSVAKNRTVELCKSHLVMLLRVMERVCGHRNKGVVQALLEQRVHNRVFPDAVLFAHIQQTVSLLEQLPEEWRRDEYKTLVESIASDLREKKEDRAAQLASPMLSLSMVQLQQSQMEAHRGVLTEHTAIVKTHLFVTDGYPGIEEFCASFESRFPTPAAPCLCKPRNAEDSSIICDVCREKAGLFTEFVKSFSERQRKSLAWENMSEQMLRLSAHQFESVVISKVFKTAFPCLLEDMSFYARCVDVSGDIALKTLLIPEAFHFQAPWPLAQNALRRISLFRAPYDMYRCLVDTWKIIFSYLRPVKEDSSPDDYMPIMAFVILQTNPQDFISTIQYISLYTTLDGNEALWLLHTKSAVEILWQIFSGKVAMWRSGRFHAGGSRKPTPLLRSHRTVAGSHGSVASDDQALSFQGSEGFAFESFYKKDQRRRAATRRRASSCPPRIGAAMGMRQASVKCPTSVAHVQRRAHSTVHLPISAKGNTKGTAAVTQGGTPHTACEMDPLGALRTRQSPGIGSSTGSCSSDSGDQLSMR